MRSPVEWRQRGRPRASREEYPSMISLNIGCGAERLRGYVNVDRDIATGPEALVDLAEETWPWPDGSVRSARAHRLLEEIHAGAGVPADSDPCWDRFWRELHRVCADGARIDILADDPGLAGFRSRPAARRAVTIDGLRRSLDRRRDVALGSAPPSAVALGISFAVLSAEWDYTPEWRRRIKRGKADERGARDRADVESDVIAGIHVRLIADKRTPFFEERLW